MQGCSQNQSSSNDNKTTVPNSNKAVLAIGKKIYNTYCLTCHGKNGDMGASGAHNLTKTTLGFDETVNVISEGRGPMTPHKFLGKQKIEAVAQYIQTLKPK